MRPKLVKAGMIGLIALALMLFVAPQVLAPALILQPNATAGKDTWLDEADPTANFGASNPLELQDNGAMQKRPILEFKLSSIPTNARILNATLTLKIDSPPEVATAAIINRLTENWTEGTGAADGATWNTRNGSALLNWTTAGGTFDAQIFANETIPTVGGVFVNWTITQLVQGWVNGSFVNNGLILRTFNEELIELISSDAVIAADRPKLTVAYSLPPNVTILSPSAGAVFNTSQTVNIMVNATNGGDEIIDTVQANVTLPNGSTRLIALLNQTKDVYNGTFTETTVAGLFNITILANNTNGTSNNSVKTNFTVPLVNTSNISIIKTDSPDPVNASSNLTYTINVTSTGNTTAFNTTVSDTYPAQVIFLTAQPTPLAGTNNTFILGNLTAGTSILINITVLVQNITNGTIINNTVNVTFQNETSHTLSRVVTQNTTVQKVTPAAPAAPAVGGGGGGSKKFIPSIIIRPSQKQPTVEQPQQTPEQLTTDQPKQPEKKEPTRELPATPPTAAIVRTVLPAIEPEPFNARAWAAYSLLAALMIGLVAFAASRTGRRKLAIARKGLEHLLATGLLPGKDAVHPLHKDAAALERMGFKVKTKYHAAPAGEEAIHTYTQTATQNFTTTPSSMSGLEQDLARLASSGFKVKGMYKSVQVPQITEACRVMQEPVKSMPARTTPVATKAPEPPRTKLEDDLARLRSLGWKVRAYEQPKPKPFVYRFESEHEEDTPVTKPTPTCPAPVKQRPIEQRVERDEEPAREYRREHIIPTEPRIVEQKHDRTTPIPVTPQIEDISDVPESKKQPYEPAPIEEPRERSSAPARTMPRTNRLRDTLRRFTEIFITKPDFEPTKQRVLTELKENYSMHEGAALPPPAPSKKVAFNANKQRILEQLKEVYYG